jgi:hypothetical protein
MKSAIENRSNENLTCIYRFKNHHVTMLAQPTVGHHLLQSLECSEIFASYLDYGLLACDAVWYTGPSISEEPTGSIFRIEEW